MSRRAETHWEPQHRASTRHRVAIEAARLLYHREMKEYFHAKREAARRQGTPHLPSNREVHEQLLLIARKVEGDEHLRRLERMRQQALSLMEDLAAYHPRLIGSVLTGHIRQGSDIDLNLYSEELDPVLESLSQAGREFTVDVVRSHKNQQIQEFIHVRLSNVGGFEAEITVYPLDEIHHHPRCGITGGPMKRATLAEVRQLTKPAPPALSTLEALSAPVDLELAERLIPELSVCRGVLQNNFHHLDVYDHTVEVLKGLERMVVSGYQRFGQWAPRLREHLASPTSQTLLYLAALCHDLAKPQTQTFARDGRIRFHGHDRLGADMVRHIGPRLGLSQSDSDALVALVECHLQAVMIPSENAEPSRIHRLFRTTGPRLPELALLSMADVEASRGPAQSALRLEEHEQFVNFLLEQFFESGFLAHPTSPVSEDDLWEQFGEIAPKLKHRLQEWLLAAYVDGDFESREEGLALAGEFLASPHGFS